MPLPIMPIAMGAGALLKGVSGLFGDSEEEKRNKQRKRLREALLAQIERNKGESRTEKYQADTELSSEKADRRNVLSQKLAQYGYEPGGSIATNEKDLVLGNIQRKGNIDTRTAAMNNAIMSQIGEVDAGMEEEPGGFGTFLGNMFEGANIGAKFGQALGGLDLNNAEPGIEDTPELDPKVTPVSAENTNNMVPFSLKAPANDIFSLYNNQGYEGEDMLNMPETPDYTSMMKGYDTNLLNPTDPFNKIKNKMPPRLRVR